MNVVIVTSSPSDHYPARWTGRCEKKVQQHQDMQGHDRNTPRSHHEYDDQLGVEEWRRTLHIHNVFCLLLLLLPLLNEGGFGEPDSSPIIIVVVVVVVAAADLRRFWADADRDCWTRLVMPLFPDAVVVVVEGRPPPPGGELWLLARRFGDVMDLWRDDKEERICEIVIGLPDVLFFAPKYVMCTFFFC